MNSNTLTLVDIPNNKKIKHSFEGNGKKHDIIHPLLETNKDSLRSLLKYSTDIITILDTKGTILYESPSIETILGYTQDEIVGRNAFEFVHKDDRSKVMDFFFAGLSNTDRIDNVEFRFLKSNGSYVYLESGGMNVTEKDNVTGVVVNSRDVTAKRDREVNIRKLTQAVEQSSNTIVITDINGRIEYVNKKFEDLTGYLKEEVIGSDPNLLRSSSTTPAQYKDLWTTILTGKVWEGEFQNTKKNGEIYWEKIKITPIIDSDERITNFIAIKDDITDKKLKDEQLEKSLKEKEMMLKEIHHRVKNNLQIVSSLLNLQAESVEDTKLKAQLTISQNRVRSMAIIHQLLYRAADLSSITIEEYLYSISGQLLASYAELKDKITIKIDAVDIKFTIETAVPFGLLINELITNSLKHGFPNNRKGIINITLKESSPDNFELIFKDNGIGIPITLVNGHVTSFGMYLIEMLVNQLEGTIENFDSEGTSYKIQFTTGKYRKRFHVS